MFPGYVRNAKTRDELVAVLIEAIDTFPNCRIGQIIAHAAAVANQRNRTGISVFNTYDEEIIFSLRGLLAARHEADAAFVESSNQSSNSSK